MYNVLPYYIILKAQLQLSIRQNGDVGPHSPLANAIQLGVEKLDEYLDKAKLQSVAAIATILNSRIKLNKLHELGWSSAELAQDRQTFLNAFDAYVIGFGSTEENTDIQDEDSDDELAIHGIINPIALSPIKASGTEAERYLNEPILRKSDKKTYTEFWHSASTFYPILAQMARDYGTIPATSVPSESVFSIAGLQITKRRNRLAPKTMGVIMCLRSWGLIEEGKDDSNDDDDDSDDDIRKDREFGRTGQDDVVVDSQLLQ